MTGYQAYQGNQVDGAGPLGLILLTYDALHKALGRARMGIETGDLELEGEQTARALEALIELSSALNMEAGGEVAENLARLYAYMVSQLTEQMCSGSSTGINEVLALTQTLRDGWKSLEHQKTAKRASASRSPVAMGMQPAMAAYGL